MALFEVLTDDNASHCLDIKENKNQQFEVTT